METSETVPGGRISVLAVWVIAAIGAVIVVVLAYAGTNSWFHDSSTLGVYGALGVVFAASVLLALLLQLATRQPKGYVERASASLAGAGIIVVLAAIAVAPVAVAANG